VLGERREGRGELARALAAASVGEKREPRGEVAAGAPHEPALDQRPDEERHLRVLCLGLSERGLDSDEQVGGHG
jgi:hypothetical protein